MKNSHDLKEVFMRITPENCITIAVDYQTRLVPSMAHERELIHNSRILLQGLRVLDVPVLVSQQYTKGLGETVPEIRELVADCPVFDKITFSCWQNDAIREAVIASGRKTVIICGIESHVCALQTVIDLCADGYRVVFVEDCVDSRKDSDKATALRRAEKEGAILTSYEALLFELTQIAGNERFKKISALVK